MTTNRRFHPERASSKESCRKHGSRGRGLVLLRAERWGRGAPSKRKDLCLEGLARESESGAPLNDERRERKEKIVVVPQSTRDQGGATNRE